MILLNSCKNFTPRFVDKFNLKNLDQNLKSRIRTNSKKYNPDFIFGKKELPLRGLTEITSCSPVMSTSTLIRIRDNASRLFLNLRNTYNSINNGLDSQEFIDCYEKFWTNMYGHNWCIYQNDEYLVDQINHLAEASNIVYENAGDLFEKNFRWSLKKLQDRIISLKEKSDNATNNIVPVIEAYNYFWDANFDFDLHWNFDPELDYLMMQYSDIMIQSNKLFEKADDRIQANFLAQFNVLLKLKKSLKKNVEHWRTIDGHTGYQKFIDILPEFDKAWLKWIEYIVLQTPENEKLFNDSNEIVNTIITWINQFPEFKKFNNSKGIKKGGGIAEYKFYAENSLLKLLENIGVKFNELSKNDLDKYVYRNLFITSLSYEHGGKMPPHSEHRTGEDADLWGIRLDQGEKEFDKKKTLALVIVLLELNVSRLIYTDKDIVDKANQKVPNNAVAVNGSGHKDHIHIDF
jgi:hypothetical protein